MKVLLRFAVLAVAATSFAGPAPAQQYPTRPVRMLIGFPPGGGTDIVGRIVAQKLSENLGQQIIVENRGGATGMIGAELTAKAPPDGYTIMMAHIAAFSIMPSLYPKMPYDAAKDFAPITLAAIGPNFLVVHPSLPVRNVKELVALAKARPGQLHYASPGAGSVQHLSAELFKLQAKVDMLHVPYKGSGQSIVDLIAGQVHLNFDSVPPVLPHVRSGRLRALAVSSAKRNPTLPDVPTTGEAGVRGADSPLWFGVWAPAGTPADIVQKISVDVRRALTDSSVKEKLHALGNDTMDMSPAEFAKFVREEMDTYQRVIKAAGIKPQ